MGNPRGCNLDTSSVMKPGPWGTSGVRSLDALGRPTQANQTPACVQAVSYAVPLDPQPPGRFFTLLLRWCFRWLSSPATLSCLRAPCRDCPGNPLQLTSIASQQALQALALQASSSSRCWALFCSWASSIRSSQGIVHSNCTTCFEHSGIRDVFVICTGNFSRLSSCPCADKRK